MARLARKIGRGHDAIYHGTRHLPLVLRTGKLLPATIGDPAIFFTRSPEVAAYWAGMLGNERDKFSGGILVLNRASLAQNYRLVPSRYAEDWEYDEREESVWRRSINIRRHLLGVVRHADVDAILGPPRYRFFPDGYYGWSVPTTTSVLEGRKATSPGNCPRGTGQGAEDYCSTAATNLEY
jgi:hypothetical protein